MKNTPHNERDQFVVETSAQNTHTNHHYYDFIVSSVCLLIAAIEVYFFVFIFFILKCCIAAPIEVQPFAPNESSVRRRLCGSCWFTRNVFTMPHCRRQRQTKNVIITSENKRKKLKDNIIQLTWKQRSGSEGASEAGSKFRAASIGFPGNAPSSPGARSLQALSVAELCWTH